MPTPADPVLTGAVLSHPSFVWFGWAQESPPAGFAVPLGIAALTTVAAAAAAWGNDLGGPAA